MKKIDSLIIHCSDSSWGCAREINKWHLARGFSGIGYQFVILNGQVEPGKYIEPLNGSIECGRDLNETGAHCIGYNDHSLGICLVLKDKPTIEQLDSLKKLTLDLCRKYDISPDSVLGHCETASGKEEGKTCPNFDIGPVRVWLKGRI